MTTRLCTDADFPALSQIIESNQLLYGVPLDAERHRQYLATSMALENRRVVGVEEDGRLMGFSIMILSLDLPIWYIPVCFFEAQAERTYARGHRLGSELFEAMFEIAEAANYYDFYYIVKDSNGKRKSLTYKLHGPVDRYDIEDIEFLEPHQQSRFKLFNIFLGPYATTHTKKLVVRAGHLKKEFRPWK